MVPPMNKYRGKLKGQHEDKDSKIVIKLGR